MSNIPVIDMVETGRNIVNLREKTGYSVRELQSMFGFTTPQAIYKWQNGTSLPTIDNLLILSSLFGVTVEDIIVTNVI